MIVKGLRNRKRIEEVCNKYLFNKGFYDTIFPKEKWYYGNTTQSGDWDKRGVDVFATTLDGNQCKYIDEKATFSGDELHIKVLGNSPEGVPAPRAFFDPECLTTMYLFYLIKDNCGGNLGLIQTEADIEELEVFLISKETIKGKILEAFQEGEEELFEEAIQIRSSVAGKIFTRSGISLFHNKCNRGKEDPVHIDIPKSIANDIAIYHGKV